MSEDCGKTSQDNKVQPVDYSKIENTEIAEKYKIVGKQGSGGCSIVYDAWRIIDGRHVAIKVLALPDGLEQEEAVVAKQRFYREARILMSLKNEHSVNCYEYGLFNGAPCVVLEFVDGQQLDNFLRDFGALPFEYGVGVICQILEALAEAHSKGVIHRDIKPANILIIENSEPPVARLIDFGIASLQEGALGEIMKTRLGTVRGTPAYMAPELFSSRKTASPESDLYAIGLVLCEILTGAVCVAGASLMQIAYKQKHEELVIPELVPECLAKVIRKCCEKKPADRYHSAEDVIKDLQANLPEACEKRDDCEEAYLKSIKERNGANRGKKGVNKVALFVGIGVFVLLLGLIGYSHIRIAENEEAAEAAKAEASEAAKQVEEKVKEEHAAQEAAKLEAVKAAEAKAREEAAANIEAAKAEAAEAIAAAQAEAEAKAQAQIQTKKAEKPSAPAAKSKESPKSTSTVTKKDPNKGTSSNPTGKKSTNNIPVGLF